MTHYNPEYLDFINKIHSLKREFVNYHLSIANETNIKQVEYAKGRCENILNDLTDIVKNYS
jgi:hypothetical protein